MIYIYIYIYILVFNSCFIIIIIIISVNFRILEMLIEKCSTLVFDKDVDGNTPLHLAACNGWKHSVKLLIERCASVNAR